MNYCIWTYCHRGTTYYYRYYWVKTRLPKWPTYSHRTPLDEEGSDSSSVSKNHGSTSDEDQEHTQNEGCPETNETMLGSEQCLNGEPFHEVTLQGADLDDILRMHGDIVVRVWLQQWGCDTCKKSFHDAFRPLGNRAASL